MLWLELLLLLLHFCKDEILRLCFLYTGDIDKVFSLFDYFLIFHYIINFNMIHVLIN